MRGNKPDLPDPGQMGQTPRPTTAVLIYLHQTRIWASLRLRHAVLGLVCVGPFLLQMDGLPCLHRHSLPPLWSPAPLLLVRSVSESGAVLMCL